MATWRRRPAVPGPRAPWATSCATCGGRDVPCHRVVAAGRTAGRLRRQRRAEAGAAARGRLERRPVPSSAISASGGGRRSPRTVADPERATGLSRASTKTASPKSVPSARANRRSRPVASERENRQTRAFQGLPRASAKTGAACPERAHIRRSQAVEGQRGPCMATSKVTVHPSAPGRRPRRAGQRTWRSSSGAGRGIWRRSRSSTGPTPASCSASPAGCSATRRTPRICCRRSSCRRTGSSTASAASRRSARGCTGWRRTTASTTCGAGRRARASSPTRSTTSRGCAEAGSRGLAEQTVTKMDLERALARLPEGCRAAFVLHDVEGLEHREVGRGARHRGRHVEVAGAQGAAEASRDVVGAVPVASKAEACQD